MGSVFIADPPPPPPLPPLPPLLRTFGPILCPHCKQRIDDVPMTATEVLARQASAP